MPGVDSTKPQGVTDSEASDEHVTDAFALLGHETRLNILLAIWEAHDLHANDNTVVFSQILERVGHDDPGNLRYHIEKLEGQFVRQHTERGGYELRIPGQKLVQAVIAGAGVRNETLAPTEIDQACPFCEAPTTISYREGILFWSCTKCGGMAPSEQDGPPGNPAPPGPLTALPFDPAGLANWTPEELRVVTMVLGRQKIRSMFNGICPTCSGPVDSWFDCCPDHDPTGTCEECGMMVANSAWFQCRTCENHLTSMPHRLALLHPPVASFYDDHGVSTRVRADDFEQAKCVYDLMLDHEVELVAEDPVRVAVTATIDGDTIQVIFDEMVRVIDVSR